MQVFPVKMDTIMDIARRHNLLVIEDAAQGVMSEYIGGSFNVIGDFDVIVSAKQRIYMGEGGLY